MKAITRSLSLVKSYLQRSKDSNSTKEKHSKDSAGKQRYRGGCKAGNADAYCLLPSNQSSAAQSPEGTRPSSQEHERASSSCSGANPSDDCKGAGREGEQGPHEAGLGGSTLQGGLLASVNSTGYSLSLPTSAPTPRVPNKSFSSWFSPNQQQWSSHSDVALGSHDEAFFSGASVLQQQEEAKPAEPAPSEQQPLSAPLTEVEGIEQEYDSSVPNLKSVIGSMRLHIDHPVAHTSNARGCVFKAYWSNACVAVKISASTDPPPVQRATSSYPMGAELNHPNIVQTYESRTGFVSKQFLQSPCALSSFSSCSGAMEQLCPVGIMEAAIAAAAAGSAAGKLALTAVQVADVGADASQAAVQLPSPSPPPLLTPQLPAQSSHPSTIAPTAAAAAVPEACHGSSSVRVPDQRCDRTDGLDLGGSGLDGQAVQQVLAEVKWGGTAPAADAGAMTSAMLQMDAVTCINNATSNNKSDHSNEDASGDSCSSEGGKAAAGVGERYLEGGIHPCWSDSDQEEGVMAYRRRRQRGRSSAGDSSSSCSTTNILFESGDGFGAPTMGASERTPPMEWSQIMKAAGVKAGDYVILTLMDWCDCGTLHHAMSHAVFSLAPSRPPSPCGLAESAPVTTTDADSCACGGSNTAMQPCKPPIAKADGCMGGGREADGIVGAGCGTKNADGGMGGGSAEGARSVSGSASCSQQGIEGCAVFGAAYCSQGAAGCTVRGASSTGTECCPVCAAASCLEGAEGYNVCGALSTDTGTECCLVCGAASCSQGCLSCSVCGCNAGSGSSGCCTCESGGGSNPSSASNSMRGVRTRYRGLLRTARDIAQGLEYLHCSGLTHGALEPSNVLLKGSPSDARGFVARLSNCNTSLSSVQMDPTQFTAPEVREGRVTSMHPSADMWSFGVLLRVMVSQSLEAAHPGRDFGQIFDRQQSRSPSNSPTCSTCSSSSSSSSGQQRDDSPAPMIPHELMDLYHRCASLDPSARPSAHEAVVLLVALEMQLRSKLSKQVWQQQHAHEQEWEAVQVQARATQLQMQHYHEAQLQQAQAHVSQWGEGQGNSWDDAQQQQAPFQGWGTAGETRALNARQLQQQWLAELLKRVQQQGGQYQGMQHLSIQPPQQNETRHPLTLGQPLSLQQSLDLQQQPLQHNTPCSITAGQHAPMDIISLMAYADRQAAAGVLGAGVVAGGAGIAGVLDVGAGAGVVGGTGNAEVVGAGASSAGVLGADAELAGTGAHMLGAGTADAQILGAGSLCVGIGAGNVGVVGAGSRGTVDAACATGPEPLGVGVLNVHQYPQSRMQAQQQPQGVVIVPQHLQGKMQYPQQLQGQLQAQQQPQDQRLQGWQLPDQLLADQQHQAQHLQSWQLPDQLIPDQLLADQQHQALEPQQQHQAQHLQSWQLPDQLIPDQLLADQQHLALQQQQQLQTAQSNLQDQLAPHIPQLLSIQQQLHQQAEQWAKHNAAVQILMCQVEALQKYLQLQQQQLQQQQQQRRHAHIHHCHRNCPCTPNSPNPLYTQLPQPNHQLPQGQLLHQQQQQEMLVQPNQQLTQQQVPQLHPNHQAAQQPNQQALQHQAQHLLQQQLQLQLLPQHYSAHQRMHEQEQVTAHQLLLLQHAAQQLCQLAPHQQQQKAPQQCSPHQPNPPHTPQPLQPREDGAAGSCADHQQCDLHLQQQQLTGQCLNSTILTATTLTQHDRHHSAQSKEQHQQQSSTHKQERPHTQQASPTELRLPRTLQQQPHTPQHPTAAALHKPCAQQQQPYMQQQQLTAAALLRHAQAQQQQQQQLRGMAMELHQHVQQELQHLGPADWNTAGCYKEHVHHQQR